MSLIRPQCSLQGLACLIVIIGGRVGLSADGSNTAADPLVLIEGVALLIIRADVDSHNSTVFRRSINRISVISESYRRRSSHPADGVVAHLRDTIQRVIRVSRDNPPSVSA